MKSAFLSFMLLVVAGCQPEKGDPATPGETTAKAEETSGKNVKPADADLITCKQVFDSWAGKGFKNARFDAAAALPETNTSLPFDSAERVGAGTPASREESVGIVGVGKPGFRSSCTGTLISDQWVLTAAHCGMRIEDEVYLDGYEEILVYVGSLQKSTDTSGQPRKGTVYCHPDFVPFPANDLALIRLDKPVYGETPVLLPRKSDLSMSSRSVNTRMQVFGFGALEYDPKLSVKNTTELGGDVKSEVLRTGVVKLSKPKCGNFPEKTFCSTTTGSNGAPSIGVCRGDSGGPLFIDPDGSGTLRQFGVNSYMSGGECGQAGVNSGFADVTHYLDWISKVTGLRF